MFDLQYNRNTFNPNLRKDWQHSTRQETRELCEARLKENKSKFEKVFGFPNNVLYRIIEVK